MLNIPRSNTSINEIPLNNVHGGLESDLNDIDDSRVKVEYFSHEKSFKERLRLFVIQNQKSSFHIRIFILTTRILICILYAARIHLDSLHNVESSYELPYHKLLKLSPRCWNLSSEGITSEDFRKSPCINWDAILYLRAPLVLWVAQVTLAVISYSHSLILTYLNYKGNILESFTEPYFLLDTFTSLSVILTTCWPPLRFIYIPTFLTCWLAKRNLENIFNDLNRVRQKSHSALAHKLLMLFVTMSCLVFTGSCAIEHIQKGGNKHLSLFESFWYIVVTFSTVGYGDIYPDIWPSQLFMIVLIVTALIVLPSQFEQVAFIYIEKKKRGTYYSKQRAENERHVVVCAPALQHNQTMDFLNEFYAHPKLQNFYVVLLSPNELEQSLANVLHVPMWSQRVIYIQGSALNNTDLNRAQVQDAEACFLLVARNYPDRQAADQHTILRSWAIKDYAPNCVQYVHLLRPENKMHVQHAKYVVCEDEFKYALLANNCICPGLSTFVTLLLHTSRGLEGTGSSQDWQRLYGNCSGNEIYHIRLGDSKFFGEYEGKSFTYASFHAHRKFGVALVGVQSENDVIKLNAGPAYIMKSTDTCFYMSITKEENSSVSSNPATQNLPDEDLTIAALARKWSYRKLPELHTSHESKPMTSASKPSKVDSGKQTPVKHADIKINIEDTTPTQIVSETSAITANTQPIEIDLLKKSPKYEFKRGSDYYRGVVPYPPYVGSSSTKCHLLKKKTELCCLRLNQECLHSKCTEILDYKFPRKPIILAADTSDNAIYNFIVPLRASSIPKSALYPIIFVFEQEPNDTFLQIISNYPMVYWMAGRIDNLEQLLKAGILEAEYLIIIKRERSSSIEELALEDCNTILTVQYIFRMFPKIKICCEVVDSSNMRFLQFRADDQFSLQISKREKIEAEKGSQIPYLFRLPFAGGNVFSATMLDTLLYQSFVKNYLISFVRLMLGIDQAPGSGHLSSKTITNEDSWIRTYGRLYQFLCSSTFDIPIGIYRTDIIPKGDYSIKDPLEKEIGSVVQTRMQYLRISSNYSGDDLNEFSYVIINPCYDLPLKTGDIIFIIKPSLEKVSQPSGQQDTPTKTE